jgi:(p)ppGpp synthase/HD superfamily hydrolase
MIKKDFIVKAAKFAEEAHKGQVRKYSLRPYITHPGRVAASVTIHDIASPTTVAAAWTHDVVEDTKYSLDDVANILSDDVSKLVDELTNPSKGVKAPRRVRKEMDRDHLKNVSHEAKILKLLDRTDNIQEMIWDFGLFGENERDFARLYAKESRLLVSVIEFTDKVLVHNLYNLINDLTDLVRK